MDSSIRRSSLFILVVPFLLAIVIVLPLASSSSHHLRERRSSSNHAGATGRTAITFRRRTTTTPSGSTPSLLEEVVTAPSFHQESFNGPRMIAVQAPLGGTLFLHCPVSDMADEDFQVSWVRLPDWRIIASGRHVYENGKDGHRFRVLTNQRQEIDEDGQAAPGSSPGTEWTLQIRFSSLADGGLYDCQVSTGTGVVTHHFNVSVVVPTTTIVGGVGGEYHVDKGSAIRLSCLIHNIPQEPQFIFWYHNGRMINYDDSHLLRSTMRAVLLPRVEVLTESDHRVQEDRVVSSQLTIRNVTETDSGNYTCAPSNAEAASTIVYVSEWDDAAAAIQVNGGNEADAGLISTDDVTAVMGSHPAVAAAAASNNSGSQLNKTPWRRLLLLSALMMILASISR